MTTELPRIVHLASGREWRGGQRQVLLLARALARRGINQTVVTTSGSRLAGELMAGGVPVHAAGWHRGFSIRAFVAGLTEARREPCLLHAHDAHALTLAGLIAAATDRPFVVTRRVDFHLRRPGFWRRANRVIAISDAVRRILIDDGIEPGKIVVVNSGIDLSSTERIRQAPIRVELGLPASGPLAVAIGALVDHKDHQTLIRAAFKLRSTHPDLHWAVAGEGDLRVALEREVRDLGLGSVVHLLGQIAEPLRLIRDASVFVMSSKEEGLGTSVLDAMAIGTPVVATRAGGIPEMVDGGAGILVPRRDPDLLAAGVAEVLDGPDRAARLVATASKRVASFSADGMAEGVLQVYRSIVIER